MQVFVKRIKCLCALLIGHGYLYELNKSLFQLHRSIIETRPLLLWPIRWPTLVFIELITRVSSPLSMLLIILLAMLKSRIPTCIKVWSWLVPHVVHFMCCIFCGNAATRVMCSSTYNTTYYLQNRRG